MGRCVSNKLVGGAVVEVWANFKLKLTSHWLNGVITVQIGGTILTLHRVQHVCEQKKDPSPVRKTSQLSIPAPPYELVLFSQVSLGAQIVGCTTPTSFDPHTLYLVPLCSLLGGGIGKGRRLP